MIFTALYAANLYMKLSMNTARSVKRKENIRFYISTGF